MEESTLAFEVLHEHFVPLFEGAGRRASLSDSAEIQSARLNLAIDLTLTDGSAVRIASTVDSAPDLEQEVALELRALLGARYAHDDEASRTP